MPTFKVTLAYDGGDFVGWQRQASGVSVQGLLEDALRELDERDVGVTGAGRTDAGVHALGQVAGFSLSRVVTPEIVVRALNARLPSAVRVLSAEEVPARFHARFDARAKTYRYRIWNGDVMSPFERSYAWHVPGPLDVGAMTEAATIIEGRHDFAAFQATGSDPTSTEREVFSSLILRQVHPERDPLSFDGLRMSGASRRAQDERSLRDSRVILYEIKGNGFLRHMVRAIVGTIVDVGRGRRPPAWMADVIASRDRSKAGPTAPAAGLFLVGVEYL